MRLVLSAILFSWGFLFVYFVRRYLQRRRLQSIVVAFSCAGWPLFIAREFHWLHRWSTVPFVAAALTGGVFGCFIILWGESQR